MEQLVVQILSPVLRDVLLPLYHRKTFIGQQKVGEIVKARQDKTRQALREVNSLFIQQQY